MVYIPPEVVTTAGSLIFGGQNPRSGGADPCCPPGYDPAGVWPRNSNVAGAPPDYRSRGAPMTSPSPSGIGRLKDDFCDCIPITVNGRRWVLGEVRGGKVYTGPPTNRDDAVWVEVNAAGTPISVPGVGGVGLPTSSGGGGTTWDPGAPGGGGAPALSAGVGPLLAAAVAGFLFLRKK